VPRLAAPPADQAEPLAVLRERPTAASFAGGYGPLIVGVILFALIVLLAPTVAPEQVVEEPVGGTTTTAEVTATTSTSDAASTTVPVTVTP
jgi:hypothetical protein